MANMLRILSLLSVLNCPKSLAEKSITKLYADACFAENLLLVKNPLLFHQQNILQIHAHNSML